MPNPTFKANITNKLLHWSNSSLILPFYKARPRAVALASYTLVDKIIKNTVGFTSKDIWNDYN